MKILLFGLFFVLMVSSPFIYHKIRVYGAELSAKIIMDLIKKESNNYYAITYESAQLSLFDRTLEIEGLKMTPDSVYLMTQTVEMPINSFELYVPALYISLESFTSLFIYEELKIKSIRITDPEIGMVRTNEPSKKRPFSLEAGDLYLLISQYLKLFKIEHFNIHKGAFTFDKTAPRKDTSDFSINSLDFSLNNFLIDSKSSKEKGIFFSENIDLIINDQVIFLSDSVHQFTFDRLTISTASEIIIFEGLQVMPRSTSNISIENNPQNINVYDISIPILRLKGVDFMKAYTNNQLLIDSIGIVNPKISLYDGEKARTSKPTSQNSLSALLIDYFDEIVVGNLALHDGSLNIKLVESGKSQDFKLDHANIDVDNFRLDSLVINAQAHKDYFDHINIEFQNYTFNLPDSTHKLYLKAFRLSTKESVIRADSVLLFPRLIRKSNFDGTLFNAYMPLFQLSGFDWHDISTLRQLQVQELYIPDPRIEVIQNPNRSKADNKKLDIKGFARTLLPIFHEIAFERIKLENGTLHLLDNLEELLNIEKINLTVGKFHINEAAIVNDRLLFFSDNIDLSFSDFDIEFPDKSHLILVNGFKFSSTGNRIILDKVSIKPIHQQDVPRPISYNGLIQKIEIQGLSRKDLVNNGFILLENIIITSPDIDLVQHDMPAINKVTEKQKPPWLKYLNVKNFALVKGKIRLATEDKPILNIGQFNLSILGFSMDSLSTNGAKGIGHKLTDLLFDGDQVSYVDDALGHQLKVQKVALRQHDETLIMQGVLFSPLPNVKKDFALTYASPLLTVKGFNLEKIIIDKVVDLDEINLNKSNINFEQFATSSNSENSQGFAALYDKIAEKFVLFDVDKLHMDSTELRYKYGQNSIAVPNLYFGVSGFHVSRSEPYSKDVPFLANDYTITVTQPVIHLPGALQHLSLHRASFSTQSGSLDVEQLHFVPNQKGEDKPIDLVIPRLHIDQMDINRWVDRQELVGKSISINDLSVAMYATKQEDEGTDLPTKLVLPFPLVAFDSISARNSTVTRHLEQQDATNTTTTYTHIDILIHQLYIDSNRYLLGQPLFYSDNVVVSGKDLGFMTEDSLFNLKIGSYSLSTKNESLSLGNINITPRYDKYEFGEKVGSQSDWMQGKIRAVGMEGVDIKKLLLNEGITIRKINIDEPRMEMFRDKRIPFPQDQLRPLPHMALMNTATPIEIDQVDISQGNIIYEEFVEDGSEPGHVFLENLQVAVRNMVNTPVKLSANRLLTANISTKLMGVGDVSVDFKTTLGHADGQFDVAGSVGPMDLTAANQMLEHVAFIKIRSGQANNIEMNFTGDNIYAMGEMKFFYKNLKISLLSKDTAVHSSLGHAIGSFFANTFIVRSNNPNFLLLRKGDIYYERDISKSMFNYWSKAILSGIVSSIGAKSNKRSIRKKNKENLKIYKERMREEKFLEDKIGIYD